MNLYWVYDIPTWLFALLVVGIFIAIALIGQRLSQRGVKRIAGKEGKYNELVGTTLATVGVFFGITLGLISVGTWQNFADINTNVNQEVASLGVLYRTVSMYPEPASTNLKAGLQDYVYYVMTEAWPLQRKGIVPQGGVAKVTAIQKQLAAFEPVTESMKAIYSETLTVFNQMVMYRRTRLQNVTSGLPPTLWIVVIAGALLNLFIPWFLVYDRPRIHDLMSTLMAATIGLLIFLMGAMDNPFRGEVSISAAPFRLLYQWMTSG
jgi:Protein of unknown function (DUF4239)